ncbi:chemotaxis protein CheA [Alicyclobacillus macrosporangiidus]|uniref:Chemotaxis protein CheA n=1 Tax=Alicyclobacillus macrosporangiidus TaxID=392015 RepID=A0A1I7IR29_9BACL|nr:chemotaxis protein CheA [Alicyclobacillus macrosporangiidus]SFU75415.1 two-component system, chemotaxis family, sensor kinase CheA [Alicyclobacillus macrosporangiidus]
MENLQYLQAFLDESEENLQVLNELCLRVEQGAAADGDFAAMFRAAHTLKGMSATMGFQTMATVTHRLEDLLGVLRDHPERVSGACVDALFESLDVLSGLLERIRDAGNEAGVAAEETIGRLTRLHAELTGAAAPEVAVTASPSPAAQSALPAVSDSAARVLEAGHASGMATGWVVVSLDAGCVMPAARALLVMRELEQAGTCVQCEPDAERLQAGDIPGPIAFLMAFEGEPEPVIEAIAQMPEVASVGYHPWIPGSPAAASSAPAAGTGTSAPIGPSPASASAPGAGGNGTGAAGAPGPAASAAKSEGDRPRAGGARADRTIRVPVERLDTLMNLLSELVIDRNRLGAIAAAADRADLRELSDHVARIAGELQSAVMSLRMVPIEYLFQRFPRMVRDLAKTLDKEIRLEMSGLETEFDRTIIDEMGEVLVHLIRNSADHGLEPPEDRRAAGKPEAGVIQLRAYASGQHVFIEVADDGRGIDVERVRRRAIERGLVDPVQAGHLSDEQVYEFLFASGFSTAETVSDISGRGVGLDAVRQKVESLGGRVEIESVRGQGTTFRIRLPLTLAMLEALLVEVAGHIFAIPLTAVEEVVAASSGNVRVVHGTRVLDDRGKLVPLVDVGTWLLGTEGGGRWLVVCREGNRRAAFAVERLLGQREIVHKSLGEYLAQVPWFAGAAILGDGGIALIADVHAWMNGALRR